MAGSLVDKGASKIAREQSAQRQSDQYRTYGLHVGIVMDDVDDQKMGRLMVFIPGFSTPGVRWDYENRAAWFRVSPVFPFFGSNDFSDDAARLGDSQSYGWWGTPRKGDQVAVFFAQGDTSQGYWFGAVPKMYQNFMVPGVAIGEVKDQKILQPGKEVSKNSDGQRKPAGQFNENLAISGLLYDQLRGGSTSGASRESPSRVYGLKTPGDAELGQVGHQLVLDDLPANQLVRIRSSRGNQVLLCDTGRSIYISTAEGKNWIELREDGHIDVYSQLSISVHSEQDVNITAGRDLNLDIARDVNMAVGGGVKTLIGGDLDLSIVGDARLLAGTNLDISVGESYKTTIGADYNVKAGGGSFIQAEGDNNLLAGGYNFIHGSNTFLQMGAEGAADAAQATAPASIELPGPPTPEQVAAGDGGNKVAYVAGRDMNMRVPQHEPWPVHEIVLAGTNTHVRQGDVDTTIRRGSTTNNERKPLNFVAPDGTIYDGQEYETNSPQETPKYVPGGSTQTFHPSELVTSDAGLDIIKKHEGFVATVYKDVGGLDTIGYGHLIKPGEHFTSITEAEATELLRQDVRTAEQAVRRGLGDTRVTQNQFDALVSFTYNVGGGAFLSSTLLKRIKSGDYGDVPNQLLRWNKVNGQPVKGLTNRRRAEAELFATV